jgi:hypothetical protein
LIPRADAEEVKHVIGICAVAWVHRPAVATISAKLECLGPRTLDVVMASLRRDGPHYESDQGCGQSPVASRCRATKG